MKRFAIILVHLLLLSTLSLLLKHDRTRQENAPAACKCTVALQNHNTFASIPKAAALPYGSNITKAQNKTAKSQCGTEKRVNRPYALNPYILTLNTISHHLTCCHKNAGRYIIYLHTLLI